jgi:two-component system nitrogen regulation response regulator NtrX
MAPLSIINCQSRNTTALRQALFGTEPPPGPREALRAVAEETARQPGKLEQVEGGTLVLREVWALPMALQAQIIRLLQEQGFRRGDTGAWVAPDVRVIATSSQPLEPLIAAGTFREDLYYRLNVQSIEVPSLASRRADILTLADHYLSGGMPFDEGQPQQLADDARAALQAYAWPGNVRQLRNVIDGLAIMAQDEVIDTRALPAEIMTSHHAALQSDLGSEVMGLPMREAREVFERRYLLAQVTRFSGNISRTAHFVGMERSALHRKLKSLGVLAEHLDT